MNSKLAIFTNGRERVLSDDMSLTLEFQNPIFTDNAESYSYPVELPIDGNRDLLKNLDDVNSDMRAISLEHTPMQIVADGIPLVSGPMVVSEDTEISDSLSVSLDTSADDFKSLIGDLTCRDIPIPEADKDSLVIGEKISDVKVKIRYKFSVYLHKFATGSSGDGEYKVTQKFNPVESSGTFEPQALGFSYPAKCDVEKETTQVAIADSTISYRDDGKVIRPKFQKANCYTNVTDAYEENARGSVKGGAKFCNARVCYKHYKRDADGFTSDDTYTSDDGKGGPEDRGIYWVLDAHRPQSGICFYVLYFLECLFKHLKLDYDISVLKNIEDMRHLCFYTTKCSYKTRPLHGNSTTPFFSKSVGSKTSTEELSDTDRKSLFDAPNLWLSSRGCGGQLELEKPVGASISEFTIGKGIAQGTYKVGENIDEIKVNPTLLYAEMSANISEMIADEGNFPEMSVSSLLSSLENMFGVKFSYDYEQKKVTVFLLRDIFTHDRTTRVFNCRILYMNKMTEKITGVRVGYSEEDDAKEQKKNVKNNIKDYDTSFNYIDYPDPSKASKSKTTVIDKVYAEFFRNPSHGDENVYIDQRTGNAYRIKINKDYSDTSDMHPVLFEVGQFKGVEEGDCSEKNEDYVVEMKSEFVPINFTDVNYEREKEYIDTKGELVTEDGSVITTINESDKQPLLAAFMSEDMEHEFVEQRIRQNVAGTYVDAYITEVLKLVESYDPSKTDDGNSPLQSYDWGYAIAMMRGGGADATLEQFDSNYDGFGNNKWMMRYGLYALTSDSIDQWQDIYDYNGIQAGGLGEHFSLKPRAYKQPSWAEHPLCDPDLYNEETGERIRIMSRGYVDTFLKEYIYFLLNRKKYRASCFATIAQIADVRQHWRDWWIIDGKKCLIRRVYAEMSAKDGLGKVELEIYTI